MRASSRSKQDPLEKLEARDGLSPRLIAGNAAPATKEACSLSDDYERWWNARKNAIESLLGKMDRTVGRAVIPFDFGA